MSQQRTELDVQDNYISTCRRCRRLCENAFVKLFEDVKETRIFVNGAYNVISSFIQDNKDYMGKRTEQDVFQLFDLVDSSNNIVKIMEEKAT